MTKVISLEGPGVEKMNQELRDLQTRLGILDIGEVLAFCVNITASVVRNAQHGLQLGFYDSITNDVQLYESPYLTTLLELSQELTDHAPEDPPPD